MRRRGLTTAELVVATGLLSMLIVMVAVLFSQLLAAGAKSGDQLVGIVFGQKILDETIGEASSSYPAFSGLSGQQGIYTEDEENQTQFFHTLTATELMTNARGELWQLDVDVAWWTSDGTPGSRAGYGKLSVHQSRTVYISR